MNTSHQHQVHKITLIAGILSCLSYLYLAVNSQEYGQATLSQMLSVCFFCAAIFLFRAIGFFAFPVLEDDIYRYLWDGRQTVVNGNPYLQAPSDFFF